MSLLLSTLRRLFALFTFYVHSIPSRLRTGFINRFGKSFIEIRHADQLGCTKLAIVALYPRESIYYSTERLIRGLEANGYHVFLVVNNSKLAPVWLRALDTGKRTILVRNNHGRDFGAYAEGFNFIVKSKKFVEINKIVFCNDSVFYGPRSKAFISELLFKEGPWISMFLNFQFHLHSQSFFQVFDASIFQEDFFIKFWKNYSATNLRHLTINKGEVRLSQMLLRHNFKPEPFVTAESILESNNFVEFNEHERFSLWCNFGLKVFEDKINNQVNSLMKLQRVFLENNPTHHAGLLASRTLGAPLKLDILRTGLVTVLGVKNTLSLMGCNDLEVKELMNTLVSEGTHASRSGFTRLWSDYGLV